MAQAKKKRKPQSASTRGSAAGGARASGSRGRASAEPPPRRREIAGAACFLLAVFSAIGYFTDEGVFIGFFHDIMTGLVGYGFFALAPVLLLCSGILFFHGNRPVIFRTVCALLLPVVAGALVHLAGSGYSGETSLSMVGDMWYEGQALTAGGAIAGSLAKIFADLFSKVGATILFVFVGAFLLLAAINKTVAGIVDAYNSRERRQYVQEPEPEYDAPMPKETARSIDKRNPPYMDKQEGRKKRKGGIDIPIDEGGAGQAYFEEEAEEENLAAPPKQPFFKPAKVKTPAELVVEYVPDEAEKARNAENVVEDMPLDIPFMEKKWTPPTRAARPKTLSQLIDAYSPDEPEIEPESPHPPKPAPTARQREPVPKPAPAAKSREQAVRVEEFVPPKIDIASNYTFPPMELLSAGSPKARGDSGDEVRANTTRLEAAFRSFGVNVKISNTTRGPSVTRYEAELEAGVKLNKLTGLADDIALSLGTNGVRIAAMPNKISTVGIEVPNRHISTVYLRDILESDAFRREQSKLAFAVGMDISGETVVGNIAKLPHMLVAGTTGSGKSVCLNSIILSILYKATPEEVRLIMVDPKMVEFNVYNGIPHLLVPVVTDVKKAAGALQWAVVEMMKRYSMFSEKNARDLEGYNAVARKTKGDSVLPQVVVVIDELADLMMMAAKEVEESICRVAQMGRAAGVHLVIATQSPRADVITGLMKANIPSRIALKVASALESRIILDAGGNADKLVGNGDMLYAPIGSSKPMRLQGTWVSDAEREKVVKFIKRDGRPEYSEEVMGAIEKASAEKAQGASSKKEAEGDDYDELLPQAADVIFETGQASVSILQRRLKLGYSRAARIVDQLEELGVVGPFEGSKPRAMLVTREEWMQMQYIRGTAPTEKPFADRAKSVSDDG